jgi:hypothetical protein
VGVHGDHQGLGCLRLAGETKGESEVNSLEHNEQAALFRWAAMSERMYPELALMYAIPNAARRSPRQGAWPDIHLPVAAGKYIGLWIEMKAGRNKPSVAQARFLRSLAILGHKTAVCYNWDEARAQIEAYLNEPRCA